MRGAGSQSSTMWPGSRPTYIPSGILVHPAVWPHEHWPKIGGGLCPFRGRAAGSPSNTMSRRPRPKSVPSSILIYAAVWPQQTWAENWGAVPPFWGGAGSPSNTAWPGPIGLATSIPSGILIHPTVWPEYTNVTDTGQIGQHTANRFTNGRPKTRTYFNVLYFGVRVSSNLERTS